MNKFFLIAATLLTVLGISRAVLAQTSAIDSGINYLKTNQDSLGKISGYGGESDWAAIAFSAAKTENQSLKDFLIQDKIASSSAATDIERRILAIHALNSNPEDFGGINYLNFLENKFDNNQIGDSSLLNDDAFGLLALIASGKTEGEIIEKTLDFLISAQNDDGGFSWSATPPYNTSDSNDTSSAIQALIAVKNSGIKNDNLDEAISKSKSYLLSTQKPDGGFGYDAFSESDGSSTAWALMALNVLGMGESEESTNAKNFLLSIQKPDGGFPWIFEYDADTYTTSHALIGLLGQNWLLNLEAKNNPDFAPLQSSASHSPSPSPSASSSSSSTASDPSPSPSPSPSLIPSPSASPIFSPLPSFSPSLVDQEEFVLPESSTAAGQVLGESKTPQPKTDQKKHETKYLINGIKYFVVPASGITSILGLVFLYLRRAK